MIADGECVGREVGDADGSQLGDVEGEALSRSLGFVDGL